MKKILLLLTALILLLAMITVSASATVVIDKEHDFAYYVWQNAGDIGNNQSGAEPQHQLVYDFKEINGQSGIQMRYSPDGSTYDPYISLQKINLGPYKYAAMRCYFGSSERDEVEMSMFFRHDAGSGYAKFKIDEANKWVDVLFSFDGLTGEWNDSGVDLTWFRINVKVEENESFYVRWLALFKTPEEAEDFSEGFADKSAYDKAVNLAKTYNKAKYSNYDVLENALKADVSGYFFGKDQSKIDEATADILSAIDALIPIGEIHGDPVKPEVTSIQGVEIENKTPDETTAEEQTTEGAPTETTADQSGSQTTAEASDDSGCNSAVCLPTAVFTLLGGFILMKGGKKHEK